MKTLFICAMAWNAAAVYFGLTGEHIGHVLALACAAMVIVSMGQRATNDDLKAAISVFTRALKEMP